MTTERLVSKTGLKLAGTCLLVGCASPWFVNVVLTIPVGWTFRPLLVTAALLAVGIAVGFALRIQGGDTDGR